MAESVQPRFGYVLSHEQFLPQDLIEFAVLAEQAGFDGIWSSDHFHPWMHQQGHATHAWVTLGALGQRTRRLVMGTGVTCPTYRYRPAEVAQAFATLGVLYPGRVFLGVGSGEALNEVPAGGGWDAYAVRAARMREAVQLIQQLWTGEWVDHRGEHYVARNARIYDLPPQPVPIYIAASGPKSARHAGEIADGWITDPKSAADPALHAAFREGARAAGKDPAGLRVLVEHWVIVGGRAEAEAAARTWRFLPIAWKMLAEPDPRVIGQTAEAEVALEDVYANWVVSDDPRVHVEAMRTHLAAGVTDLFVHSGQADQRRVIEFYRTEVLPRLRRGL